jgi:hypothetical protein
VAQTAAVPAGKFFGVLKFERIVSPKVTTYFSL